MRQRRPRQVIVDERRFGTNTPETPPDKDELFGILAINSHDILGLDAICGLEPLAIPQRGIVYLRISP